MYRTLLVEDNAGDTRLIEEMLREGPDAAFRLECVGTLAAGLGRLRAERFDAVLLDLGLPDSQGLDTFARVEAEAKMTAILVLTGNQSLELAIRAVEAGAQDYLVKGQVTEAQLRRAIAFAYRRTRYSGILQVSEARYRNLVEEVRDGIWALDRDGVTTYVNQRMADLVGRRVEELIGASIFAFLGADRTVACREYLLRTSSPGVGQLETELLRGDGTRRDVLIEASATSEARWDGTRFLLTVRDVTEQKRAERTIRDLARLAFESPHPVLRIGTDGTILYANEAAAPLLRGWGQQIGGRIPAPWRDEAADALVRSARAEVERDVEERTYAVSFAPYPEHGYVNLYGQDVTEQRRAKAALRAASQRLTIKNKVGAILLSSPDASMYGGVLDVILDATRSSQGLFGYLREDGALVLPSLTSSAWEECRMEGKTFVFPSETWGQSIWGRSLRERRTLLSNTPLSPPDGHIPIERALCVPILHEGRDVGLIAVANRGTDYGREEVELLESIAERIAPVLAARLERDRQEAERRHAEEALRRSETLYRSVVENATDLILIVDERGAVRFASPSIRQVLGYGPEDVLGRSFLDYVHPDERAGVTDRFLARLREGFVGAPSRCRIRHAVGGWRSVDFTAVDLPDGPDARILVVARDVTEHLASEEALRESEARVRTLSDATWEGIFIHDRGTIVELNQSAAGMVGLTREEVVGRAATEFVSPESHELATEKLRLLTDEPYELKLLRSDGSSFQAELQAKDVKFRGQQMRVVALRDITGKKELEERYRQAHKMEAIGRLAGGVAHDFNNLLTVISGYAETISGLLPPGHPCEEPLDEIRHAAARAATLTRQLLAFSRKGVASPRAIDMSALVADAEKMLRRVIGEDIQLVTRLGSDLPSVKADPGQIEQVLLNLVVNARDAMPAGGRLTIETDRVSFGKGIGRTESAHSPGPYVALTVADTGLGMDAGTMAHVFEPFFTTKEVGKGTGLGLATVYGIVKQSGGDIRVESEPGHGATFRIFLPVCASPAAPRPASIPSQPLDTASGRILLVEDEEAVRALFRVVLRGAGYSVVEARDGSEALTILAKEEAFDLVVTDVVMPGMGGKELVDRTRAAYPELKALFVTGYATDTLSRHGVIEDGVELLQKPFRPADLLLKVRSLLVADRAGRPLETGARNP